MDENYYKRYEPVWGHWNIKREIGRGSFGCVYEIERQEMGVTYRAALKAISIPSSNEELKNTLSREGMTNEEATNYYKDTAQFFFNECVLMSKLKGNTNIVGYEDHQIYQQPNGIGWDILIRMELLTPLVDHINSHTVDEKFVIELALDMCDALILCEKENIIHRDIKPDNIFVSPSGRYKLGDFGVARILENNTGASTKVGTVDYTAPEVFRGALKYDNRVDIYSLGMVMYKLLNANRLPFVPLPPAPIGFAQKEEAKRRRMSGEKLPKPANASVVLGKIILKACEFDPVNRYKSAVDLKNDLERYLKSLKNPEQNQANPTQNSGQVNSGNSYSGSGTMGNSYGGNVNPYGGNMNPGNSYPGNSYPGNSNMGNAYGGNYNMGNQYSGNSYPNSSYGTPEKKKNPIAIIAIIAAVLFGLFIVGNVIKKSALEKKYNYACQLVDNEEYDEAIEIFESLGDYKDSEERIQAAKEEKDLFEAYKAAIAAYNNNNYFEALQMFVELGTYKDSASKKEACKSNIRIGDTFKLGSVEWIVFKKNASNSGNYIWLTSTSSVAYKPYNDKNDDVGWFDSSLRVWLNGEFLNETFSSVEIKKLSNIYYTDNDNVDKVTLITKSNLEENDSYFYGHKDRSILYEDGDPVWWWLLNRGNDKKTVMYVSHSGDVVESGRNLSGEDVDHTQYLDGAVRPVILINLNDF